MYSPAYPTHYMVRLLRRPSLTISQGNSAVTGVQTGLSEEYLIMELSIVELK